MSVYGNPTPPVDRVLIRTEDAADLLSMSNADLLRLARNGEIPVAAHAGRHCLFSVAELRHHFGGGDDTEPRK